MILRKVLIFHAEIQLGFSTVTIFQLFCFLHVFTLKTKHFSDVRWVSMVPFGDTVFQREAASLCCLITLMCLF